MIYLSPIVGTGTEENPFRALWSGIYDMPSGTGWIDLRPDCTVATGFGILSLAAPSSDPRLTELCETPDEALSAARRRRFGNALGLTLLGARFHDLLAELLLIHARTDGSRWRPLLPTIHLRYEIWLGGWGRIFQQPLIAGGSSLAETWPTNGTTISSGQDNPWTEDLGDVAVVANHLECVSADVNTVARCTADLTTANQRISGLCTISAQLAGAARALVCTRKIASTVETLYTTRIVRNTAGDSRGIAKYVSSAFTGLATDTVDPGGAQIELINQVDGSSLSGTVGGAAFGPVTDTAITGNTQVAVAFRRNAIYAQGDIQIDTITAQDLANPKGPLNMPFRGPMQRVIGP